MNRPAFFLILFGIFCALSGRVVEAHEKQTITWYYPYDFPPFHISKGEHAGQGATDQCVKFLFDRLPDFKHDVVDAHFKRTISDMSKGKRICSPGIFKTPERENFMDFSSAHTLILAPGLVTSKANADKFSPFLAANGELDIEKAISSRTVKVEYSKGRRYAAPTDDVIAKYGTSHANHLIKRADSISIDKSVYRLLHGRIDGILGNMEAAYLFNPTEKDADQLVYIPISGAPRTTRIYAACTKGKWNDSLMTRVEDIIMRERKSENVLHFYQRWLPPGAKSLHQKLIEELF